MNKPSNFFPYEHRGPGVEWNMRFARTLAELDRFGLMLADRGHIWSPKERATYERRLREFRAKRNRVEAMA